MRRLQKLACLAIAVIGVSGRAEAVTIVNSTYKPKEIGRWHIEPSGNMACIAYTVEPSGRTNILVKDQLVPGARSDGRLAHLLVFGFSNDQWRGLNQSFGNRARVSVYFPDGEGPDGTGTFQEMKMRENLSLGWGYLTDIGVEPDEKEINAGNVDRVSDLGQTLLAAFFAGAPMRVGMGTQIVAAEDFGGWKDVRPEFEKCLRSWFQD